MGGPGRRLVPFLPSLVSSSPLGKKNTPYVSPTLSVTRPIRMIVHVITPIIYVFKGGLTNRCTFSTSPPFLVEVLNSYPIHFSQVTPTGWWVLILLKSMYPLGGTPTIPLWRFLFRAKNLVKPFVGWYPLSIDLLPNASLTYLHYQRI